LPKEVQTANSADPERREEILSDDLGKHHRGIVSADENHQRRRSQLVELSVAIDPAHRRAPRMGLRQTIYMAGAERKRHKKKKNKQKKKPQRAAFITPVSFRAGRLFGAS